MLYESTRGTSPLISSAEAILQGIAGDGGLFVPTETVKIDREGIQAYREMTYQQRAVSILGKFLSDFSTEEISACVESAYDAMRFDAPAIAPLKRISGTLAVLELWHGPTCAFKDMALQILPRLLVQSAKKVGDTSKFVILVATSGDTGKAALEGFKDVPQTQILVFYPSQGVSEIQKLQMITQEGSNLKVIAVEGNFDDTQNGVKKIFNDRNFKAHLYQRGYKLSSANSINWGRLVPQIIYYFSAYADMLKRGMIESGSDINFVVPTGNFGNILAGYYARTMGLPINKLICAANSNNVLTDFINTGIYDRRREFYKTISPSMDILISSNLERLLFDLTGREAGKVSSWMQELQVVGAYQIDMETKNKLNDAFWSAYSTDEETMKTIKHIYQNYEYVLDTHTAVAWDVYNKYLQATGDGRPAVIVSTASPFKFNASVVQAILGREAVAGKTELELLGYLAERCRLGIPAGLENLEAKKIKHQDSCQKDQMQQQVVNFVFNE